jgi:hypothetical protein
MCSSTYLKKISGSLFALLFSITALAQRPLVSAAKKAELDRMAAQLESTHQADFKKALDMAPQKNWTVRRLSSNGTVFSLQRLNALGFPVIYKTYNNIIAAATTRTNTVQPGGSLGLNLSGSSTILNGKLAIWDGGSVFTGHQEFAGKAITLRNPSATVDLHTTHVAGTMLARGLYPPARGMAFNASTLQSYDFNNDIAEITAAAANLLLSNHSYGLLSGWEYNSDEARWEWYGLPGDSEDYKFGYYDSDARNIDQVTFNAPFYLPVIAAGNSRGLPGPAVGTSYWGYTSRTNTTLINKGPRPAGISSNNGYEIIPGFGNAKNVLTVGAINQLPYGPVTRQEVAIASFSGFGPTDDGRIKPDICGDGDAVLSTSSSNSTAYTTLSGTSMATPNVTGSLYLLQELYAQRNSNNFMRSATLKALVCHTAFDAGNIGPDYMYGWGVLDMARASQAIVDRGGKSAITETTLAQGQTFAGGTFVASGNGPVAVTIAWTDPQATQAPEGTLNERTPKLVNDLDVTLTDGTNTYNAWVLDPANPAIAATRGNNTRDNIEQVYIENAVPGRTYTVTVRHKGTLVNGSQPFSMVITGIGGTGYCASAPNSNADSRIDNFTLANINNTPAVGCTTYSDYTNLTAQLEQGRTYPLSITLGTCGSAFNKVAKVFVDWNGDGTFDPVTELAATTGVISGNTGTYTTNITIPATVIPGNYSLMRVVLTETNNAANVTPCGSYDKGETQDYRVLFIKAASDAGAIAVSNSAIGGGCAGTSRINVRIKNFGTAEISNIPVTVTITTASGQSTTLTETYTGTLPSMAEDDFILNGTYNTTAGATYTLTATTNLANDAVAANNRVTATVVIGSTPVPTGLAAFYCDDSKQYLLTGNGDGAVLWYTVPTGGTPVAAGQTAFTTMAPVNNTYYAALNDYNASVGPTTKYAFSGGSYGQFAQAVTVTTKIPVIIQSARLYVGNAGRVTVIATNVNGEEVARTTLNVAATRTTPAVGNQADDLADQGQVYNLNLLLPNPGAYRLSVVYANNATLYRSNGGVTGYPFGNDVFNITRNNATLSTNPSDTTAYRAFYYYFYDMKVTSAGCASASRVPVVVNRPVITQNGSALVSNFTANNQWYLNDELIPGATGQTFAPAQSGNYQLKNLLVSGCTAISPVYTYIRADAVTNTPTAINLSAYPVPATTELHVSFVADAANDMSISLVNTAGQAVYNQKGIVQAGNYSTVFSVASQPAGTYVLRVLLGRKAYSAKIIIVK